MAVTLIDDVEKGPGYALFVFDRHIGATRLEIAILHSNTGRYLGPSTIDRAHWQNQPSFALVAEKVSTTGNQSVFRVGPEITTHIPSYSTVVVSTADGSINETVYWDVVIDPVGLAPPPPPPPPLVDWMDEERKRQEEERKRQEEEEKKYQKEEQQRLVDEERELLRQQRREAWKARLAWLMSPAVLRNTAIVLLAFGVTSGAVFLLNTYRHDICDIIGIFCDAEGKAYNEARTCAASKTCGASICTAPYRQAYPKGHYIEQISEIDRKYGGRCVDPEEQMFITALTCLRENERSNKHCDAVSCFQQFESRYPNSQRINPVRARLQIADRECQLSRERPVFEPAERCARRQPCGANACFDEYQRRFPNGLLRQQMNNVLANAQKDCAPPPPPPLPGVPIFVPRTNEKPSFDCTKPHTAPAAVSICADGELAQADGELGRVYNDKRSRLRGAERDAFTKAQFEWIDKRDSGCGIPASGSWRVPDDVLRIKRCLLEKTQSRKDELSRN